jgi:hypothetical protein
MKNKEKGTRYAERKREMPKLGKENQRKGKEETEKKQRESRKVKDKNIQKELRLKVEETKES